MGFRSARPAAAYCCRSRAFVGSFIGFPPTRSSTFLDFIETGKVSSQSIEDGLIALEPADAAARSAPDKVAGHALGQAIVNALLEVSDGLNPEE
ncbi:hypothetical protein [Allorhizobium taibaishanense]|uniref:Uncharacterized protein n=1 Tax=Allorhizobium taibaishanense TaxID=887144 RepID=A0A1Q9A5C7_9HYPH|nr:hypothetical protein [Allorhizobium taibaishanense]MBB4006899.1 hypothetical protein [Allorhizobium taibaishanense]OLP49773.1 hypothetical protein BJF91_22555 [Allorhizobium taibaishanense]